MTYENILDLCIEALKRGETVESCLAMHPAEADRLEPVLRIAARLQRAPRPEMSAAAFERGREQMLEAVRKRQTQIGQTGLPSPTIYSNGTSNGHTNGYLNGHAGSHMAGPSDSHADGHAQPKGAAFVLPQPGENAPAQRPSQRRGWSGALMLAVAACMVLVSTLSLQVATRSLPGDFLYPVKRAGEEVQGVFLASLGQQASWQMRQAKRRVHELMVLEAAGRAPDPELVAEAKEETGEALALMPALPPAERAELLSEWSPIIEDYQHSAVEPSAVVTALAEPLATVQAAMPAQSVAVALLPTVTETPVDRPGLLPMPGVPTGMPPSIAAVIAPSATPMPAAGAMPVATLTLDEPAPPVRPTTEQKDEPSDLSPDVPSIAQPADEALLAQATVSSQRRVTATPTPQPTRAQGSLAVTPTPTRTPSRPATATPTPKRDPVELPKSGGRGAPPTATVPPTATLRPLATFTPRPEQVILPTVTNTPRPTATATPQESAPVLLPTVTNTPAPLFTATPFAPATPTALATEPPTETLIPTVTPTPSATDSPTPTPVVEPTATPQPDDTPTVVPTSTKTATALPTVTSTATSTALPTSTDTPVPTNTPVPTSTNTPVPTNTPAPTSTPEPLDTPTPEATAVSVSTDTPAPTNTPVPVATDTPAPTDTPVPPPANTSVPTETPEATPIDKPMPPDAPKPGMLEPVAMQRGSGELL